MKRYIVSNKIQLKNGQTDGQTVKIQNIYNKKQRELISTLCQQQTFYITCKCIPAVSNFLFSS